MKSYKQQCAEWEARRKSIIAQAAAGKPLSVIARNLKITRQRVYQIVNPAPRKNGRVRNVFRP